MKRIFVCSPYRGDIRRNTRLAELLCEAVLKMGHAPFAPHLHYTRFLDEDDARQREAGLACSRAWIEGADELWYWKPIDQLVSPGMATEINKAQELNLPIRRIFNLCHKDLSLIMGWDKPGLVE